MAQTPVWRPAADLLTGPASRLSLRITALRSAMASLLALTLAGLLAATSAPASAFTLSDGSDVACHFSHGERSGTATERWVDYQTLDQRDPELGKAVAVVRFDPQGHPTILIDAVAYRQSKTVMAAMWDFIYFHECAHAQDERTSEIGANCAAYIAMQERGLMNAIRSKDIEAAHLRIMNLPEQYGGNGMAFWRMTLECVDRERPQSRQNAAISGELNAR